MSAQSCTDFNRNSLDGTTGDFIAADPCIPTNTDNASSHIGFMIGCAQTGCPVSLTEPMDPKAAATITCPYFP